MKPDVHFYMIGSHVHKLVCQPYETHLLSRIPAIYKERLFPVFIVRRRVVELIPSAERLLRFLEDHKTVLEYRYGIKVYDADGNLESSGGGGIGCNFGGIAAIAEAGPGFCHIKGDKKTVETNERPILRDLRDMQEVVLDNGMRLIPMRKHRPFALIPEVAKLVDFLSAHSHEQVVQSRSESAK